MAFPFRRRCASAWSLSTRSAPRFHLTFCDTRSEVVEALQTAFEGVPDILVTQGDLLQLRADAIVSPANSFGDMGGGLDKAIDGFFGGEAQRAAMNAIRAQFFGELPVGAAIVLAMPSRRFRFLICAPTMRVPGPVRGSLNAYLAMRGALVAAANHNQNRSAESGPIESLAIPGLASGIGGLEPGEVALQMRAAFDNICGGGWEKVVSPALAPFAFRPLP